MTEATALELIRLLQQALPAISAVAAAGVQQWWTARTAREQRNHDIKVRAIQVEQERTEAVHGARVGLLTDLRAGFAEWIAVGSMLDLMDHGPRVGTFRMGELERMEQEKIRYLLRRMELTERCIARTAEIADAGLYDAANNVIGAIEGWRTSSITEANLPTRWERRGDAMRALGRFAGEVDRFLERRREA